jgi:hypothetical protein
MRGRAGNVWFASSAAGMKHADWFGRPDMTRRGRRGAAQRELDAAVDETGEEASSAAAREPG